MSRKNSKLSLQTYLKLSQLFEEYRGTHEENRSFALKHETIAQNPIRLLLKWLDENQFRVTTELKYKRYLEYRSSLSAVLGLLFFVMGVLVGLGLLSYSGQAPVNVIYYLLIAMVVPLLSMLFSFFSIITNGAVTKFLELLFPLHWVEKLFSYFSFKKKVDELDMPISLALSKWAFLERLQLFSLLFSVGLLLSLLVMVVVKDIAFGWSSTLQISHESFQTILSYVGMVWEKWLPNTIPSLELVEMSHYFRLGEKLDTQMIHHADRLGAWWQFLAMTTIVYAIGLRFLFWLWSRYGFNKQLKRDFLELEGVDRLLREFETPFVSTKAPTVEKHLEIVEETQEQVEDSTLKRYDCILGWNFSRDEITLANDSKNIESPSLAVAGGSNSFSHDQAIADEVSNTVLLYVKSWEPPTMDFVDFLESLIESKKVKQIQVYPLGTVGRYYKSDAKEIAVWKRKIQGLKSKKVWVIDAE